LSDNGGEYAFQVPLFRDWLAQSGINRLVADALGDELAETAQKAEDDAYVMDGELQAVCDSWETFRGRRYAPGDLRAWLNQVRSYREQRFLFKLLSNLRFFSEMEIREKLKLAHTLVLRSVPEFVRRNISDRRRDILVTYVDGPAKSGQFYASRYAEENLIATDCVKEMRDFSAAVVEHENSNSVSVNGVVIVDDIVGTGRSLGENLRTFCQENRKMLSERSMSIVVVALCSTTEGETTLRRELAGFEGLRIDLRVCEPLDERHTAFGRGRAFWSSSEEQAEAKALCLRIGSEVARAAPLGYGGQTLLVVFPTACPNNSVALLHAGETSGKGWRPLFPRAKN
jgi:hypothetical protein